MTFLVRAFLLLFGAVLIAAVYVIKTQAQETRAEVKRLEAMLAREVIALDVLEAEIVHLQSPPRLDRLSAAHLEIAPITPDQIVTADELTLIVSPPRMQGGADE